MTEDMNKGRFETDAQALVRKAGGGEASAQDIPIKDILPDCFAGSDRIPKSVGMLIRRTADEFLETTPGQYAFGEGALLSVVFDGLPPAMVRLRTETLCEKIKSAAAAKDDPEESRQQPVKSKETRKRQEPTALRKLLKQGLPENPDDKTLSLWAERMHHDILHRTPEQFLPQEVLLLGAQYKPAFIPLWFVTREVISGSFCTLPGLPPPGESGERHRQAIAALVATSIATLHFLEKEGQSTVFSPLPASLLHDQILFDLYVSILRAQPSAVRKRLGLEIHGLPAPPLSPHTQEKIALLSGLCRGVVPHANMLLPADYAFGEFRPFAHILNCPDLRLEPGDLGRVMAKAAAFYKSRKLKTIVAGIVTEQEMAAAFIAGADFLSGPILGSSGEIYDTQPFRRGQIAA